MAWLGGRDIRAGVDYQAIRRALNRLLESALETGSVTGATASTLTADRVWPANCWKDFVVEITEGRGAGQYRLITGNTANALTVDPPWDVVPDATSIYAVRYPFVQMGNTAKVGGVAGVAQTPRDWSLDFQHIGPARERLDWGLDEKASVLRDRIIDAKNMVDQRGGEIRDMVDSRGSGIISEVASRGEAIRAEVESRGAGIWTRLDSIRGQLDDRVSSLRDRLQGILGQLDERMSVVRGRLEEVRDRFNQLSPPLAYTTTPLGANGTWSSGWFPVDGWGKLAVTCVADASGTIYVWQSHDGVSGDFWKTTTFSTTPGWVVYTDLVYEVMAPYARIDFMNGSDPQGLLRLFARGRRI
jgi:hypothetical protein